MTATTPARHPALAAFLDTHAIKRGSFTLVSGATSSYYCDGKLASFSGAGVGLIADAILDEIGDLEYDAIGGMDMGATPIVAATAMRAHQRGGVDVPAFVVRKTVKAHGTQKRVEGPLPQTPSRVVIVDDVVTTAGSIIESIRVIRELGHEVVLAVAILDRDAGGGAALEAENVSYRPLVTIAELGLSNDG